MSSSSPYVCQLSRELQEKARKELNEEPERRAQSIEIIREWIKQQPHLNARTDDAFLLRFLRNCKFSLELTKEKIDKFYTMRSALPEWFKNRDTLDPELQNLINLGIYMMLPGCDKEGRRVVLYRLGVINPAKVNMDSLHKFEEMWGDLMMDDEIAQISGICTVVDVTGFSGVHLSLWNLSSVKKQMTILQSCNPIRLRAITICNESTFFHSLLEMVKLFMKEKIRNRISFHGKNMKSLHEIVPPEILPEEYGGTAGNIRNQIDQTKKKFESRRQTFINDEQFGVDESKRSGKPKTKEDLFGTDGSFRKLNID